MTLVLTEISRYGIVMGADSAVTWDTLLPTGQTGKRVLTGVHKLLPIRYLQAGVSCWGYGQIGGIDTDIWLTDFIRRHEGRVQSLDQFASQLAADLNGVIGQGSGQSKAGFHLAGFGQKDEGRMPDFWHIHNGPSLFFNNIDPKIFNANHDLAGAMALPPNQRGHYNPNNPNAIYITRNGDYEFYATWWEDFERLLNTTLRRRRIEIPAPSLQGRVEYIRFQIRTISEIYRISTLQPSIGGEITSLSIDTRGLRSLERKT